MSNLSKNSPELKCVKAKDYCLSVRDGTHDSPKPVDIGFPLVTSKHLKSGQIEINACYQVAEDDYYEIVKRSKVNQWDVLISMIGTIGEVALVKNEPHFAIKNVGLFKSRSEADGKWLYYYLRTDFAQNYLREISRGTTQQYVPLGSLREMPIYVFDDKSEMSRIANILGTLDDKIENNRKTAKTLEAMAQAIFQSWFVDFDPVRAKMAGESPESICKRLKLTPEILNLFPDRLVDSELGEIPEGWEVKPLESVANFLNGLAMQKFPSRGPEDTLPVIKIAQLRSGSLVGADHSSRDIEPQYIVHDGDILFSWSGSLECVLWSGGTGALNQHLFKVTPKATYPRWIVYFGIHHHLSYFREIAAGKATTMGHIQRHHLSDTVLTIPSRMNLETISKPVQAMFEAVWKKISEAKKLSDIRDTLLPKLISGEIRTPEAEHLIKETAG